MQFFGSFNEMAAGMGQNIHGTMSVFNAVPEHQKTEFNRALNELGKRIVWATNTIIPIVRGSDNPAYADIRKRLDAMQSERQSLDATFMNAYLNDE
jgi:hypothetical protein